MGGTAPLPSRLVNLDPLDHSRGYMYPNLVAPFAGHSDPLDNSRGCGCP